MKHMSLSFSLAFFAVVTLAAQTQIPTRKAGLWESTMSGTGSLHAAQAGTSVPAPRYLSFRELSGYARLTGPVCSAWPVPPAVDGPGGVAPEHARCATVAG